MERRRWRAAGMFLIPCCCWAGGGPLGIDYRLGYSDQGIWQRAFQIDLEDGVIIAELVGAFTTQPDSRLGLTFRKTIDSSVFTALTTEVLKRVMQRPRPIQADNPNLWFQGSGYQSFPSGEVALQASFVTPFIGEYHVDHPWVWALEALPAYDAVGRLKTWGHWQTDVLAGWAIGTGWGLFSQHRKFPLIFSIFPHGFTVAYRAQW